MKFSRPSHATVVAYLSLFLVLTGGTALAVDGSLAGQNTVGTLDIINAEVATADLAENAVGTTKIIDGQVKNQDLGAGASNTNTIADNGVFGVDVKDNTLNGIDIAEGSLNGGAIPGTTARAYGRVLADGTITNGKNVVGLTATDDEGDPPHDGKFCIRLDGSVDAPTAAIITVPEFRAESTTTAPPALTWAQGAASCPGADNAIGVHTGRFIGRPDAEGGDEQSLENQPFYFVVP